MRSHRLAAPSLALVLGAVGVMAIGGGALAVSPNAPAAPAVAAANACGRVPLDVEIILDTSGSMGTDSNGHTRLFWAQDAATQLVQQLEANGGVGGANGLHRVGLTTFSGTSAAGAHVVVSLGDSKDAATVASDIGGVTSSSNTPFFAGMTKGAGDFATDPRTTVNGLEIQHVIIFLSDGRPNSDSVEPAGQRPSAGDVATFKAAADTIYSIAIGTGGSGSSQVDTALMLSLAKPAADYANVIQASDLPDVFAAIYKQIACTPVVTTTLTGGDQTGAKITVPTGTSVSDQAVLSGAAGFGGHVTYTVYSDETCKTVVAESDGLPVSDGVAPPPARLRFRMPERSTGRSTTPRMAAASTQLTVSVATKY